MDYRITAFEIFKSYSNKLPHPLIDELLNNYFCGISSLYLQKKLGKLQVLFEDISCELTYLCIVATHLCNDYITKECFSDICKLSAAIVGKDCIRDIIRRI